MTDDKQIKVGDVVAWADIRPMTMVRVDGDADHELRPPAYAIRTADGLGMWVYDPLDPGDAAEWTVDQDVWRWESAALSGCLPKGERVTIIALGLSGEESADDLKRLAEVFEVRQMLRDGSGTPGFTRVYFGNWATHLYDAGVRRGTGVDEAWRLLRVRRR